MMRKIKSQRATVCSKLTTLRKTSKGSKGVLGNLIFKLLTGRPGLLKGRKHTHVRSMLVSLAQCPGHRVELVTQDRQGHCSAESAALPVWRRRSETSSILRVRHRECHERHCFSGMAFTCIPTRFFAIIRILIAMT